MQGVLYVSSSEPFENPSAGTYDFQEYLDFVHIDLLFVTTFLFLHHYNIVFYLALQLVTLDPINQRSGSL